MKTQVIEGIVDTYGPRVDRGLRIPRAEYESRWTGLQDAMRDKGYDLAYACGSELDRSDIAWLAGVFDPIIERYGILVPKEGKPVLVAGSEGGHVVADCLKDSGAGLALLQEFQISDEDYRFARFETLDDVISRMVPETSGRPVRAAVLSSSQFLPHDHVRLLVERLGTDRVVFDEEILQRLKYEKSPLELTLIGAANQIADAAFLGMLAVLEPGVRELDLAAVGDYIMKRLGAGRTGFPTIVSSGDRGRSVLGPATNRVIREGEAVSLGVSPTFQGYHGIMRRTVKAGGDWSRPERVFLEALEGLYHTVFLAARDAAVQGLPANAIDRAGKAYLEKTRLRDSTGGESVPREPYTFIHNSGCSECQEGFGAVTPYSDEPLGTNLALMIDVAFMGFDEQGELIFPLEYAVIEDCFWKTGAELGVYNRMPLQVQHLVGGEFTDIPHESVNPYYRKYDPASARPSD